ncbi:MAG: hypothetical protein FD123_2448 [Bacteroidetes bacterium]|nr:MAG: hypothetical protein FD123_2448 [Bacteroidota bacterium]
MSENHPHTNNLIHETSPYLLQHAHNPVNWFAWNEEALNKAKQENKLILVSIGYSACHWCHVMEHESFEDEQVARLMNDLFVCIKVDREERPDIDQVYMHAVQLMTGQGGWPLNCFALPDGRPVYGGTYFQKKQWMNVLLSLADTWKTEPGRVLEYAEKLTEGVRLGEQVVKTQDPQPITLDVLHESVKRWSARFDSTDGGPAKAPKFPLPNNYLFLLRYAYHTGDKELPEHVKLTLKKMAFGGIYDQAGGGFARYSTDTLWKVPHFEKMLYDNAQLVSLYAEAYRWLREPLYKDVVYETLDFIERELLSPEGAFYSALDADSEGEEGKFYVWKKDELENLLGPDFPLAADYFNINARGYWEHDNYILLRHEEDAQIAEKHGITTKTLQEKIKAAKKKILDHRAARVRPGLDDKSLTSWNALMLRGYVDAYDTFGETRFLDVALKSAEFIVTKQLRSDGGLWHSYKNGRSTINGFLEDYAFVIDAFTGLYQVTFDLRWLDKGRELAEYVIKHFEDEASGMFWFTSDLDPELIARKMESSDNVIPASNSAMARNLFYLGHLTGKTAWTGRSREMLNNMQRELKAYGAGYSNWGLLQLDLALPFYELAVVGKAVDKIRAAFRDYYRPNKIFAGSPGPADLPLLQNRFVEGKTLIYVCVNNTCELPVEHWSDALARFT